MKCVNFKVRINGAAALAVPSHRAHYGRFYLNVWSALSVALYQANQLTDFNEYNHRDNLLDQVRTNNSNKSSEVLLLNLSATTLFISCFSCASQYLT